MKRLNILIVGLLTLFVLSCGGTSIEVKRDLRVDEATAEVSVDETGSGEARLAGAASAEISLGLVELAGVVDIRFDPAGVDGQSAFLAQLVPFLGVITTFEWDTRTPEGRWCVGALIAEQKYLLCRNLEFEISEPTEVPDEIPTAGVEEVVP